MPLAVQVLPGDTIAASGDLVTPARLNALASPTFLVTGTIDNADLGAGAVTASKQRVDAYGYGGTTAGTSTAYTLDFPTALEAPALVDGLEISFKIHTTGGVQPTLNLDGLGPHLFTKFDGTALAAGDIKLNQIIHARYSTVGAGHWQILNQVPVVVVIPPPPTLIDNISGLPGLATDLQINRTPAFPDSQVVVAHNGIILKHRTSGIVTYAPPVASLVADVTVAGLGGLDTGVETTAVWYYVWIYFDGTTQFAVLSLSNTVPAVIGAYHYIGLVGIVRNTGAGNFNPFYQRGKRIWTSEGLIGTALTGPGAAGATLTIPTGILAPNAKTMLFKAGKTDATVFIASFGPDAATIEVGCGLQSTAPALLGFMACNTFEIPITTPASMFWRTADTSATYRLVVVGYTI